MLRLAFVILLLGGVGYLGLRLLPPAWDPRTPLDLTAAPNLLAAPKLLWMRQDAQRCFAAFDTSGIGLTRVPDRASDIGCPLENAVRLASPLRASPSLPIVTCPLAAAWVLFERNSLQPAAREHLGSEVAVIRHLGTQACRNVNNAATGPRSQHATANAIDIAGFGLRDGREVRVLSGWDGPPREAAFLRAVRDGACRWFRAVLGPEHNAAHRDHFHFDMGPWGSCR